MLNGKKLLITGGTGSFGREFISHLVKEFDLEKIVVFSRDEMKQEELKRSLGAYQNVRYFLGDVRDKQRLARAMMDIDIVIHAAANKIVPAAEYDPFECIKTNVLGAMNVIDAAIDAGVKKVVALSTDKACLPINLYGGTKLVSDKTFVAATNYAGKHGTRFSIVRYGNVMGSRGSVIPLFLKQKKEGLITITSPTMTRFMIDLKEGVELVLRALSDSKGGEIYVKKIPSMNVQDIANAVAPGVEQKIIGLRAGEKFHEEMICQEDAPFSYEYDDYFKILPALNSWHLDPERIKDGRLVDPSFSYSSETNPQKMSIQSLQNWLKQRYEGIA